MTVLMRARRNNDDHWMIKIYIPLHSSKIVLSGDIDDKPWNVPVYRTVPFFRQTYLYYQDSSRLSDRGDITEPQSPRSSRLEPHLDVILQLLLNQQLGSDPGDPEIGS